MCNYLMVPETAFELPKVMQKLYENCEDLTTNMKEIWEIFRYFILGFVQCESSKKKKKKKVSQPGF